ncbi:glial cell line-derived neurotrophic factor [Labeo rohita]|uniref:Glial cell line-derived neurotrophic factor n=2 Tax=Labeo rohita TaxID=84645 RepID=A0ABQ8MBC1_LABRO|nr:glial cell line-derived neurotrophic factor [Labeo rohita]KAI2660184.1 Glial cell line-derived neurotrophic factor [Labeo rohita]RXN18007.1 glial cell line-derived neurotrophic factor [Labeo rohita]
MKLWDILATCLLLLSSVSARPVFHKLQPSKRAVVRSETPALDPIIDSQPETTHQKQASMEEQYDMNGLYPEQFESVMDFIEATIGRLRRSSDMDVDSPSKRDRGRQKGATDTERGGRGRGDRKRGRGRGGGGRKESRDDRVKGHGRGCLLKEIHLNVTDLGLGYRTKEELIFRYCSGPCFDAETNYDKILNNLTHNKKLDKETPSRTCCRPIAFDDDISFLDDSLEYHTLKKHSAKKCACV